MVAVVLGVVILWPWDREMVEVVSHEDDETEELYFIDAGPQFPEELPESLSREQVR